MTEQVTQNNSANPSRDADTICDLMIKMHQAKYMPLDVFMNAVGSSLPTYFTLRRDGREIPTFKIAKRRFVDVDAAFEYFKDLNQQ